MQWTEQKLKRIQEVNNQKKVPRYFAIKKLVEDLEEKVMVSWDIAEERDHWIVQFWRIEEDGTKTLVQQLDKNSDEGGSFELRLLHTGD